MPVDAPASSPRASARVSPLPSPPSFARTAGLGAAFVLLLAFGFHAYWAAGGQWGAATAYGSPVLPPQAVTAVVAVLIAAAAALLLARVGVVAAPLPPWMLRSGPWVLVAVFTLAGVTNLIQPQDAYAREWHMYVFGPLLIVLAILCTIVARSKSR